MPMLEAVQTCFAKYTAFSGRASRSEFWWFYLFTLIVDVVLQIFAAALDAPGILWIANLFSLAVLLPSLAVGARRLHDIGRTGWWQLLAFTMIGVVVLIFWWAQPGETVANSHGLVAA